MKPFLIIETGRPLDPLRRHGRFGHWIRVAAGLGEHEVHHCDVLHGETLPAAQGYAGAIVTGSGAMVSDREDWSERSADWLRSAAQDGKPLFGICYGHQLIAHALGGAVDYNPRGREMGTVSVRLAADAAQDPLFSGLPAQFPAQATHRQTVLTPPEGAAVLASSTLDDCQAFRWRSSTWGVQFHPEFSTWLMRSYIQARREALGNEGTDARALMASVRPAPQARRVLQRFVRYARACA
jgi:GMP synthase (glutamine-hydrolysing)